MFKLTVDDDLELRLHEERHVDELYALVPSRGATLIAAEFPRVYVDPNRSDTDIDTSLLADPWTGPLQVTSQQARGKSLVWRSLGRDLPIYDRKLSAAEIRHRIENYWRPYHDCVRESLDRAHARFGQVWHVNCHSMAGRAGANHPDAGRRRPDFTVSDRLGESCSPEFLECVVETLRGRGYEVRVNDPYQGMELISRYSDPAAGRHSLQIEAKRSLYMAEDTRAKHEGFETVQGHLSDLAAAVGGLARAGTGAGHFSRNLG